MAPQPTIKLPEVALPLIELGLNADRDLGQFVADTKLHITSAAFEQTYRRGLDAFWQSNGAAAADEAIGTQAAALMLEGSRRALVRTVKKATFYSGVLVSLCFLVRLPQAIPFVPVPSLVAAICLAKQTRSKS